MIDQEHQQADALRAQEPFDAFFRRERRAVIGLAYALSGSRLACEDLAQEAFVAAYRRWDEIGGYDNPGAWVRRVVANRAVSTVRRRVAEAKAIASLGFRRVRPTELPDESADLWALVRALPKRQAQAVALRYVEQLTPEEIAEVLGISRDSVYTHLRRAHQALAAELEETP